MRIHRLKLTAYGPFPDTVDINFEELNDAGIFLLNGPTGSGKSSILDAICFALYGTTSLARPDLKSHFAPEDTEPRVELECTVGGTHLRIERSPKWSRPKKRGTGYLTQQAKVLVEREDPNQPGFWETKAERNDEAGKYLTDLIGLTREQFTQVMLLPQGEFARFLTSKSSEREDLLKRLFPTDSFQRIQDELQSRARASTAQAEIALRDVETIKDRAEQTLLRSSLSETKEQLTALLDFLDDDGRSEVLGQMEAPEKSAEEESPQNQNLEEQLVLDQSALHRALKAVNTARSYSQRFTQTLSNQVRELEELTAHWNLYLKLSAQYQQILENKPEHLKQKNRLEQAHAALQVLPVVLAAENAERKKRLADSTVTQAQESLKEQLAHNSWLSLDQSTAIRHLVTEVSTQKHADQALQTLLENLPDEISLTQKMVQHEKTFAELEKKILATQKREVQKQSSLEKMNDSIDVQESELQKNLELLERVQNAEVDLAQFAGQFQRAQEIVGISQQLHDQLKKLEQCSNQAEKAENHRRALAQQAEQLQNLRYAQAAQTLAQTLQPNSPCPVCGAVEHPRPAIVEQATELVEERHVEQALNQRNMAEEAATRAQNALTQTRATVESLQGAGGIDVNQAQDQYSHSKQKRTALQQQVQLYKDAQTQNKQLLQAIENQKEKQRQLSLEITQLGSEIKVLSQQRDKEQLVLQEHRTEQSFEQTLQNQQNLLAEVNLLSRRTYDASQINETLLEQQQLANQKLAESEFATVDAVKHQALNQDALIELENAIAQYEKNLNTIETRLAEPAMEDIKTKVNQGQSSPDELEILQLQADMRVSQQRDEQLLRRETQLSHAHDDLTGLIEQHRTITQRNEKLIRTAQMHRHLADIAAGNSADNRLAMSLTTFVLASQLEEVARSATLHLEAMTHGRYRLEYSDEKQGRGKSGLEISVFDTWHAKARVPATLSGGETFMASLALALGLADVVQHRNGGIEIDTLFVDEGFGTLDESTLEEVMATLDGLREGGRVIGLISHVAEMKSRIPLHITLETSPEGSKIVQHQL